MSELKTTTAFVADDGQLFLNESDAHRHNAQVGLGAIVDASHGDFVGALNAAVAGDPESPLEAAVTKLYTAFYIAREQAPAAKPVAAPLVDPLAV